MTEHYRRGDPELGCGLLVLLALALLVIALAVIALKVWS